MKPEHAHILGDILRDYLVAHFPDAPFICHLAPQLFDCYYLKYLSLN